MNENYYPSKKGKNEKKKEKEKEKKEPLSLCVSSCSETSIS